MTKETQELIEEAIKLVLDAQSGSNTYFIFDGTSVELWVESSLVRQWS